MSTIVCQNITTTLKLKVAAAPSSSTTTKSVFGNWEFLQSQSIPPPKEQQSIDHEKQSNHFYTHPSATNNKSSFSTLSAKSLELCTENLGSESGSDIITSEYCSNSIFSSINSSNSSNQNSSSPSSNRKLNPRTKSPKTESRNFPPPLSSMSSLQVRRHADGGRLIIDAVETPFRNSFLQAERTDGRLRLCFLTRQTEQKQEQEQEQDEDDNNINDNEVEEVESEDESEKEEMNMDMDHMGIEKYQNQRLIRCSNGNGELHSSWKPSLWVAIS